ncbi:MAG TPA: tetratricopeptide repeat protein, partial [Chloroflexi bacterium]|nr:tetratricopeptide repeat protein [Chloroflexota bacterium]
MSQQVAHEVHPATLPGCAVEYPLNGLSQAFVGIADHQLHTGQRGEALRQYNICRRMLADEFGVEPSGQTQALYRRIRAAEARPRFALPAQLTSFVGRKRELAEISRLLASPDCRLLTLVGWGGVGKTRLALRYAEKNPDAFLDGTVFVPLVGVQDANHLFLSIAQALNFSLVAAPEPRLQVFEYLHAKEMLLILDNFEHLIAESAAALTDLLAAAPHVKLLVTSRERLNQREEWVFRLEGLSLPNPSGGGSLSGEQQAASNKAESILLFEQRARQADHRFVPDSHIRQICTLLAGHPLGIELSAALTAYLSPREIFEHIQTHLDMPVPPAQNIPARHRSLRIVIESSLDTLSEGERAAFRDLTVFQGGFSLDAARQVVGATPQVLAALTGKSLLRQTGNGRYEMHPVLQRYGLEMRVRAPQHNHRLRQAHSRYFAEFLFQRRRVSRGDVKTDNEIKRELENIRQAWRWAVENVKAALISKAADALGMFYYLRGWYEAGERDYQTAIERLRQSTPQGAKTGEVEDALARVLGWQGEFALNRGEYAAAQELLEESVALFQALGRPSETARQMLSLGMSVMHQGNLSLAKRYYRESLRAFTVAEDLNGAAICTEFIGTAAAIRGDYRQARQRYQESLQLYRRAKDVYGEAGGLYCLGDIARITGDYAQAQRRFTASLEAYRSINNQRGAAQAYNQLGNIARLLHAYEQAADYHRQSLWLRQEIGEQDGVAVSVTNLGVDAYYAGDYPRSRAHCAEGLAIFRELKHQRGIVFAL